MRFRSGSRCEARGSDDKLLAPMSAQELVPQVIPEGLTINAAEADAILEIAYLAILADHRLSDEELGAFRGVVGKIKGKVPSETETNTLLDTLQARFKGADPDERLRTLSAPLSSPMRELAYKVAYALGLSDMDASDEEFEFDLQLVDALELSNDRAEDLADEVMELFNGGSDDDET
ncbi:hypothetical protein BH09MYX1_BH09MYX1_44450 [soil metagenome]